MASPDYDHNGGYASSNGGSFSSQSSTMSSEDENAAKAKERDVLLWLITVAHGGSSFLRDDLKEPYYSDGQGNKVLKPDYILGLTSGELYASVLGNIYRQPNFRNLTHDGILQLLTKRGTQPLYTNGTPVTETDLSFNRPIRLRAHLLLIDAMMLLAQKESLISTSGVKETGRSFTERSSNERSFTERSSNERSSNERSFTERPPVKKTAFAPLPNTASWLNYPSLDESLNLHKGDEGMSENVQSGHSQVTNIRLALEEKRRKKQGDVVKKGYQWMQQNAKLGETAFMQSGPFPPKQQLEEEHVYEEINEKKNDQSVIHNPLNLPNPSNPLNPLNVPKDTTTTRRAKWNEDDNGDGGDGSGSSSNVNLYSTRQPPKPLPRRNIATTGDVTSVRPLENGYDMPDDVGVSSSSSDVPGSDSALQQFLSSYEKKPLTVRTKPKVIRNPNPPSSLVPNGGATYSTPLNGGATFSAATFNSIVNGNRLRSPVVQREFTNSVDVLNPEGGATVVRTPGGGVEEGATSFDLVEQSEDSDMEKKRQKLMLLQQKRRAEQEAARVFKEQENAERSDVARQRQEEAVRKKEEDRIRRQMVFESYQKKKADAKTTEDLPSPSGYGGHVGGREGKTQTRKARPLSVHASSVTALHPHHASFETPSRSIKKSPSQGDIMRVGQELSILSLHNPRLAAASARQGSTLTERRALSPPPRFRTANADSTSDAGSSNSGQDIPIYNGPKLFKKPVTKSNRLIIHNAIRDSCLPGIVNEDLQKKALEAISKSDAFHFFVLFRDANCQFRAVYSYDPDLNEALKIYGTGPNRVDDTMTEKLYKYNSGMKKFTVITTTHHMSVQIDGMTIQSAVWAGKKPLGHKAPLEIF